MCAEIRETHDSRAGSPWWFVKPGAEPGSCSTRIECTFPVEVLPWKLPWQLLLSNPGFDFQLHKLGASLVAPMVKHPPAVQETQVQLLHWEGPLEKGMATHSSVLVWRIPWTEEPGRLQSMGSQRVRYDWVTNTFTFHKLIEWSELKREKTNIVY